MLKLDKNKFEGALFRPPCKRWNCPYCQQQNAAHWAFVAWAGTESWISQGLDVVFVTVTSHEKLSVERAFEVWPDQWRKLKGRITYKYGKPEYYMVSERHQSGKLHMHAIVTRAIDQTWLKTAARRSGLGFMAHVRPVDQAIGASFYASKYLTKFGAQWPTGWRRVRLSQGWPRYDIDKPEEDGVTYKLLSMDPTEHDIENAVVNYGTIGYHIHVGASARQ
jgi:hypothetical protein